MKSSVPPFTRETLDDVISQPRAPGRLAQRNIRGDVLVLGAAGKMGLHLGRMLQRGFEENGQTNRVIAVSRFSTTASRDAFERVGIETRVCDLCDPVQLAALPDSETVWFLAGIKCGSGDRPDLLRRINEELPALVAHRFRASRMVALSTGCVYSFVPISSGGSVESSPTEPVGAYADSCLGRETAFRTASLDEGLRAVLIRLNYAVEMRYGILVDIALAVRSGRPIPLAMNAFNCIWQGDALAHIVAAADLAASPADCLNVTGPEILGIRETALAFGRRFGREPIWEGAEQAETWLNCAARAAALFGAPEIPPHRMMDWISEWLETGGEILGKPTRFEVRDGLY